MGNTRCNLSGLTARVATILLLSCALVANTFAAEDSNNVAFPKKTMLRLSSYSITSADTDIAVFNSAGVGATVRFDEDLGGDDSVSTGRLDAYYRFNDRHRIDFSTFKTDRKGSKTIDIDIDIGDETYVIGDTVKSRIEIELIRLGYAYSFYHSPKVELSLSTGLNVNRYSFDTSLASGAESSSTEVSAPLPTFGFRLGYKITPKWSLHYVSETFFIEVDDTLKGTLLNYELDIEYQFDNGFTLGAGLARTSTDLEADDSDWKGSVSDSNRGFLLYGAYYF